MTAGSVLRLDRVAMNFGNVRALDDIDLTVDAGEVVGLVGDNGAGKSTLVKVMTGYHAPTSGAVYFCGDQVRFTSPKEARAAGIEAVYQDLALIGELSLWRNFFLGKELRRRVGPLPVLDRSAMRSICEREMAEIGLTRLRNAGEPAAVLSGGERQSLAITRAVHFGARMLILDEPTAALSVRETRKVFATIEAARNRGLAVVYIDHNMAHVHPVADRIVFIEHGRVAATFQRGEASVEQLNDLLARIPAGMELQGCNFESDDS